MILTNDFKGIIVVCDFNNSTKSAFNPMNANQLNEKLCVSKRKI